MDIPPGQFALRGVGGQLLPALGKVTAGGTRDLRACDCDLLRVRLRPGFYRATARVDPGLRCHGVPALGGRQDTRSQWIPPSCDSAYGGIHYEEDSPLLASGGECAALASA